MVVKMERGGESSWRGRMIAERCRRERSLACTAEELLK
jgi:hypothetical protein